MKNELFKTKEDYLNFKSHWAKYFNETARKKEYTEYGNKVRKLEPEHFILYALIRGKDPLTCIQGCRVDTLNRIKTYLKMPRYISRKPFGEYINDDQFKLLCETASNILNEMKEAA